MIDTTTINHDVSAHVQTNPKNYNSVTKQSPIDDLISAVDDFKAKLKALSDESVVISRKVREVSIRLKQSEREARRSLRSFDGTPMTI